MDNIDNIVFEGYKCFDKRVEIRNIKPINIIIGKNNIGKSSILDIIEMMYNPKLKWQNYRTNIYAEKVLSEEAIRNAFPETTSGGGIENYYEFGKKYIGKTFRFKIEAEHPSDNRFLIKTKMPDDLNDVFEIYNGQYREYWIRLAHYVEYKNDFKIKRIYAERNVIPEEDTDGFNMDGYGNGATNAINSYLNKSKYDENIIKKNLLEKLNEIMGEDALFEEITTQQVEVNGKRKWEIFLKEKGKERVALSKSGSGLKTILLVLIHTILLPEIEYKSKLSDYIFLFEELENNLHPSLERRLLKYIEEIAEKGATIFLTTHSNTALDGFQNKENVQLYHVIKEDEELLIKNLDDFYGKSGCLDDLGIKASDILQSNGIIWVEGPSDRIYINRWIELWSEGQIKEGMDYQCVFYGGRLLSNISFVPDEVNDLIKLVNINKNSIILIDSDITEEGKRINKTKSRIKKEVELNDNLCWITKGKEIENYIPQQLLEEKYNKKFSKKFNKYDKINEYLNKQVGELAGDKFFRGKVEFAKSIVELMTKENMEKSLDINLNMKKIIEKIKMWNEK